MQIQMARKQQGFTIIELVVVILLLGILAATALPRFIDVTEQAHDSAFSGTVGGFSTGVALYRAQWVAEGQPATNTPIQEFGGLPVAPGYDAGEINAAEDDLENSGLGSRASGYPYGFAVNTLTDQSCVDVFENVLQSGAASTALAGTFDDGVITTPALLIDDVNSGDAADFQAYLLGAFPFNSGISTDGTTGGLEAAGQPLFFEATQPACLYVYSAEAENVDRSLIYVPWTGELLTFTDAESLITRIGDAGIPER